VVGGWDYRACPVAAQCFPGKAAIIYCKTNKKKVGIQSERNRESNAEKKLKAGMDRAFIAVIYTLSTGSSWGYL